MTICRWILLVLFLLPIISAESTVLSSTFSHPVYSTDRESLRVVSPVTVIRTSEKSLKDRIQGFDLEAGRLPRNPNDESQHNFYLEVPFRHYGKPAGVIIFEATSSLKTIRVKRLPKDSGAGKETLVRNSDFAYFNEIGVIDLEGDGSDSLFIVMEDGGSGYHQQWISLLNPHTTEFVEIELGFNHDATESVTDYSVSENFHQPAFHSERLFLEALRVEYGFVSQVEVDTQPTNPSFAYYYWKTDNAGIQDGHMRIRRYKGQGDFDTSLLEGLEDKGIVYSAHFKAGVIAYDTKADEHYVLFHPHDMYHWPSVLEGVGRYLLIGTHGEGLAVVNLQTWYLTRLAFDAENNEVHQIEVLGPHTVRINQSITLDTRGWP